jgi:hypothetical protein
MDIRQWMELGRFHKNVHFYVKLHLCEPGVKLLDYLQDYLLLNSVVWFTLAVAHLLKANTANFQWTGNSMFFFSLYVTSLPKKLFWGKVTPKIDG